MHWKLCAKGTCVREENSWHVIYRLLADRSGQGGWGWKEDYTRESSHTSLHILTCTHTHTMVIKEHLTSYIHLIWRRTVIPLTHHRRRSITLHATTYYVGHLIYDAIPIASRVEIYLWTCRSHAPPPPLTRFAIILYMRRNEFVYSCSTIGHCYRPAHSARHETRKKRVQVNSDNIEKPKGGLWRLCPVQFSIYLAVTRWDF